MNITKGCDCEPKKMKPILDDFGVFISTDPVAIDQACFDMAYTVVDMVEMHDPKDSIVFEVSAFGGFRGAHEGCSIDVASMYADYVIKQLVF